MIYAISVQFGCYLALNLEQLRNYVINSRFEPIWGDLTRFVSHSHLKYDAKCLFVTNKARQGRISAVNSVLDTIKPLKRDYWIEFLNG